MRERTMLVLIDDGSFILATKDSYIHTVFRNASLWEDNEYEFTQLAVHKRMLPGSTIARVRCTFEEVK